MKELIKWVYSYGLQRLLQNSGREQRRDEAEIKSAYHKLAKQYHPIKTPATKSRRRIQEINEANEVLGDPQKARQVRSVRLSGSSITQTGGNPNDFLSQFAAGQGGIAAARSRVQRRSF